MTQYYFEQPNYLICYKKSGTLITINSPNELHCIQLAKNNFWKAIYFFLFVFVETLDLFLLWEGLTKPHLSCGYSFF